MNRSARTVLLLSSISLACITRPGEEPDTTAGRGNLIVREKNGLQARVFLDYRMTDYTTPVTIGNIPEGKHTIHAFYENYKSATGPVVVDVFDKSASEAEFQLQKCASGFLAVTTSPPGAMVSLNDVDFGQSPLTVRGFPAERVRVSALLGNHLSPEKTVAIVPNGEVSVGLELHHRRGPAENARGGSL